MFSEYQMIKKSIENKGYKFFDDGDFNLNIIWIRMSDLVSNMMDDKCYILYKKNGIEELLLVDANTKPGLYGALYNPITLNGVTGTAVVQPQQARGAYLFIDKGFNDTYNPWTQSYFLQVRPIMIWRDNDRDTEIEATQPELTVPQQGICWHIQEEPISSANSKPWSTGCLGWHKNDLIGKIYPVVKEAVKIWGSGFTLTLINNSDLIIPVK